MKTNTDKWWNEELQYLSITALALTNPNPSHNASLNHTPAPEMNNDLPTFRRYCAMQRTKAMKENPAAMEFIDKILRYLDPTHPNHPKNETHEAPVQTLR